MEITSVCVFMHTVLALLQPRKKGNNQNLSILTNGNYICLCIYAYCLGVAATEEGKYEHISNSTNGHNVDLSTHNIAATIRMCILCILSSLS